LGTLVLDNAFQGFNTSLFAYGQTGSGKSYSMVGYGEDKGIIPKVADNIFQRIDTERQNGSSTNFSVECTMMEIYNEEIRDLLNPGKNPPNGLKIRDHPKTGPYVEGLTPVLVKNYAEISTLMDKGTATRTVASTNMNKTSSRAHTLFSIIFTQTTDNSGKASQKVSKISLVDLAGSERLNSTGATGQTMKEGININLSLTNLGNCISALAEIGSGKNPKAFVPYRNSVLTHIMKESLGGNSKTIMIAAISPAAINHDETLGTLRYADRAKRIKNQAIVNEDPNVRLIKDLKAEIDALKQQLGGSSTTTTSTVQLDDEQLERLRKELEQNQVLITELQMSNEEKQKRTSQLEKERNEMLEKYGILQQSVSSTSTQFDRLKHIHIVNLNEDPQMSEKLVYPLLEERSDVGSLEGNQDKPLAIPLSGAGISKQHATFIIENYAAYKSQKDNKGVKVFIEPHSPEQKVYINGTLITEKSEVKHADRIVFGLHHFFRLVLPDPSNLLDKPQQIDWSSAVQELADKMAQEKALKIINSERQHHEEEQQRRLKEFEQKMNEQRVELDKQVQKERLLFKLKAAAIQKKISESSVQEDKVKGEQELGQLNQRMTEIEDREKKYLSEMSSKETDYKKQLSFYNNKYNELQQESSTNRDALENLLEEASKTNQAFTRLIPLINEANFVSNKMNKNTDFEMRYDPVTGQLDILVRNEDTQWEAVWSVDTFTSRLMRIQAVYQKFEKDPSLELGPETDPFFDIDAAARARKPYISNNKQQVVVTQQSIPFDFGLPSMNDPFITSKPRLQNINEVLYKALKVEILEGDDLEIKDWNSSDPYCVLRYSRMIVKTKVVMQSLKPKWNASFMLDIEGAQHNDPDNCTELKFEVFDYDKWTADDFMGNCRVHLGTLARGVTDLWLNLENCQHGRVHVRFTTIGYHQDK
jgi:hypothetical protein